MLKVNEAVIVEGRYDKLKLSNIIDALIIETNGFGIYKDKKKLDFIRKLANERGLIIITDSDHSGFQIRHYLSSAIKRGKVKHIYIPDVYGKEKRKSQPSKEGKLGVEGMTQDILLDLFNKADVLSTQTEMREGERITNSDLFELKLSGTPNAKFNKKCVLESFNLPEFLSTNSFLSYVNSSMNREEFINKVNAILK